MLSHKASCNTHGQDSSYFLGWQEYEKNPYDELRNPDGIIQMGLAENQLSFDLLESWLEKNPEPSAFKRNGESIFRELALFQDYHGLPEFKKAMVKFMEQIRENKATFNPNNLVLTAGATSANETLMFCLANPGEAFLLPTPYYPGFDRDLQWRTSAQIVPIKCTSSNGFKITKGALQDAYSFAKKRQLKVKGVLVTNPSNPLGTTLTRQELNLLFKFISSKGIHLISDEIYAGTIFNAPKFISAKEILEEKKWAQSEARQRVHIVYSLSKDLGLPGYRVGAIYSENRDVVAAATKMSSFGLVSSQTQYLLSAMLSDEKFMTNYLVENKRRLRQRHDKFVTGLERAGISCVRGNAGLFCWVDMRHMLSSNTFEGEMELWKKMIHHVRLNISPGSSCHCVEPGWFRVCFANMSEETLTLAMQRIEDFVQPLNGKKRHQTSVGTKSRRSISLPNKWVFRLSINDQGSER